jgi:hypothetical protein
LVIGFEAFHRRNPTTPFIAHREKRARTGGEIAILATLEHLNASLREVVRQ